jgi:hypothetical protein
VFKLKRTGRASIRALAGCHYRYDENAGSGAYRAAEHETEQKESHRTLHLRTACGRFLFVEGKRALSLKNLQPVVQRV